MDEKIHENPWQLINVVVVEDQHMMRKAICRILQAMGGFQVDDFSNSKDAIRFLSKKSVDLVVSDIYMVEGDGFELLQYIRGRSLANDIPVIFVTGEATREDIVLAADLKVTDYIIKPFETSDFVSKIKTVLEGYFNPSERVKLIREGERCILKGDLPKAEEIFRNLISLDPDSARALVGLAQVEAHLGHLDMAFNHLYAAMSKNELYFPAYSVAADLSIRVGKKQEAAQFLSEELKINSKQPHRRAILAEIYMESSNPENALDQMKQAIMALPRDFELLLKMGKMLFDTGELEKAMRYFIRARKQNPQCTDALEMMVRVYLAQNLPTRAIHALTDMLKTNPKQYDIVLMRARLYKKLKQYEEALKDVDWVIEQNAGTTQAFDLKVGVLGKLGRTEDAFEACKQLVKSSITAENLGTLGLLALRLGRNNDAVAAYERAIQMEPLSIKFEFNLGCAYENLNDFTRALTHFQKAVTLEPGNEEAKQALRRVMASKKPSVAS